MTSVRLPAEIDRRLTHLSTLTKRSKSFYIKEALEQYLEDMEDMMIALQRMKKEKPVHYTTTEVIQYLEEKHKSSQPKKKK